MKIRQNQKGFTLIEVVLVLAIGGLIFLLAFLAFQQVSTNRRDTQRRNDAGSIISELQNAAGDGVVVDTPEKLTGSTGPVATPPATPAGATSFLQVYMGGAKKGPQGNYTFRLGTTPTSAAVQSVAKDVVQVTRGAKCTPDTSSSLTPQSGAYAVIVGLEKGSVCRDDQ
jgi:prepilin-type N-terminal cleavage/methylation domain-containing protein